METFSQEFSVFVVKIKVSTKPKLVHSNKLVLNYLILLQNICLRSKRNLLMMLICMETCFSKVKTKKCSFLQNNNFYFSRRMFSCRSVHLKLKLHVCWRSQQYLFCVSTTDCPSLMGGIQGQMSCPWYDAERELQDYVSHNISFPPIKTKHVSVGRINGNLWLSCTRILL